MLLIGHTGKSFKLREMWKNNMLRSFALAEVRVLGELSYGWPCLFIVWKNSSLLSSFFHVCFLFVRMGGHMPRVGWEILHMAASALFVTTASTETLKGTIWGVTVVTPLPVPKVTPKIVPFSKTNLAIQFHYEQSRNSHVGDRHTP